MSREYIRRADQNPSVTLALSKPASTTPELWQGWIPFNEVYLDGRPGVQAYFSTIYDIHCEMPEGARVVRLANVSDMALNPRKTVISGIMLQIEVQAGVALEDVPLHIFGMTLHTDGPKFADISLPEITPDNADWLVVDSEGGSIDCKWTRLDPGNFRVDAELVDPQTVASGSTPVPVVWDAATEGGANWWSSGALLTVPEGGSGQYLITASAGFQAAANGNRRLILKKNSATLSSSNAVGDASYASELAVTGRATESYLEVGDTVSVEVVQGSGSPVDLDYANLSLVRMTL